MWSGFLAMTSKGRFWHIDVRSLRIIIFALSGSFGQATMSVLRLSGCSKKYGWRWWSFFVFRSIFIFILIFIIDFVIVFITVSFIGFRLKLVLVLVGEGREVVVFQERHTTLRKMESSLEKIASLDKAWTGQVTGLTRGKGGLKVDFTRCGERELGLHLYIVKGSSGNIGLSYSLHNFSISFKVWNILFNPNSEVLFPESIAGVQGVMGRDKYWDIDKRFQNE